MAKETAKSNGAHTKETEERPDSPFSLNLSLAIGEQGLDSEIVASRASEILGEEVTVGRVNNLRSRGPMKPKGRIGKDLPAIAKAVGKDFKSMWIPPATDTQEPPKSTKSFSKERLLKMADEALDGPKRPFLSDAIIYAFNQAMANPDQYSS